LNRPFDDQSQDRIRLEAEAVLLILIRVQQHADWIWVSSDVVQYEVEQTPDSELRRRVRELISFADVEADITDDVAKRAVELQSRGFKAVDALHVACAEASQGDVLLTTDDRFLRAARRSAGQIHVRVENPIDWLREVAKP
jgi:predicted nucleic acid-binding protein